MVYGSYFFMAVLGGRKTSKRSKMKTQVYTEWLYEYSVSCWRDKWHWKKSDLKLCWAA